MAGGAFPPYALALSLLSECYHTEKHWDKSHTARKYQSFPMAGHQSVPFRGQLCDRVNIRASRLLRLTQFPYRRKNRFDLFGTETKDRH